MEKFSPSPWLGSVLCGRTIKTLGHQTFSMDGGDLVEGEAFVFFPSHSGFFLGFCFGKVGIMLVPSMVAEEVEQLVLQHKGSTCFSSDS